MILCLNINKIYMIKPLKDQKLYKRNYFQKIKLLINRNNNILYCMRIESNYRPNQKIVNSSMKILIKINLQEINKLNRKKRDIINIERENYLIRNIKL